MVRTFLDRGHLCTPGQLPDVVLEAAREVGWTAELYLVDYEQRLLVHAPPAGAPAGAEHRVESSLAGRCFRLVQPAASTDGGPSVWLPVVDGGERLGVLHARVPAGTRLEDPETRERCRLLGNLTGHLVTAKRLYGDGVDRVMRRRPRTVASDLLHRVLPPLTFACEGLVVSGLLQPCYDVAADAFDYDVFDDTAHLVVLDATGHDLQGTLVAAVALSAYRNSRRAGHGLYDSCRAVDEHVRVQGRGDRYATGVLGELDLVSGRLRYINAGHPAPLLLRGSRVVKELDDGRRILLGLGRGDATVAEEWLEPGDRIVFYTDGVTETRGGDGPALDVSRLVDHLQRAAAAGLPAPETLRRIGLDVLERQGGELRDDATLLMVEWASGAESTLTASATPTDAAPLFPSRPGDERVPRR
jgi:phosphoserine phosphatase RsbU/P